jgi:hypothetical protein
MDQAQLQITLSDNEKSRLDSRIWNDFIGADSNHQRRLAKFVRLWRMWRGLNETMGDVNVGPDFQVPMVKWFTFGQWARCMSALLGDDAEIIANPTAPTDSKDAAKVGRYMTWRFFEYMKSTNPLTIFVFRAILFGRAHAELIYEQDYYWQRPVDKRGRVTGQDEEKLCYDGPRLRPLWPSQFITPAQDDVQSVDDFEWVIRRKRVTPQQLLDGERRGEYQGIRANWDTICNFSAQKQERDYWWDYERLDADQAEGVDHATLLGNRDSVEVWCWYGKWRRLKGNQDGRLENLGRRREGESELLVKYIPKAHLIVGCQDLRDIYPRMKKRKPFVDLGLVKDGSYWGPGFGELLEEIQREGTINHALFRKAGMLSVGPVIFYKPSAGLDPDTFKYQPNTAIPTEDPSGVNVVEMKANLQYCEVMHQTLKGFGESTTGVADTTAGLSEDRPNAPKTASGQAMLLQEGNVRASLDMTMLREDLSNVIGYAWELDREYADDEVFFRVTEDNPEGLFESKDGFASLTSEEREHDFGFDLKFATSVYSREAKKAAILALYQLSMGNPLIAQNPRALWVLLNRVWVAFGEKSFRDIVPEPPELDQPKTPKSEWAFCLKHEPDEVKVNPMDDDDAHILDHRKQLAISMHEDADRRDKIAEEIMVSHIVAHEVQKRTKMLMQIAAQAMMERMRQAQGAGAQPYPAQLPFPPQPGPGQPGQPGGGMPAPGGAPNGVAGAEQLAGPQGVGGAGG